MTGMDHIGRSWPGDTHLEDDCPCEKAPCGLAVSGSNSDCPEHGVDAYKTLRQWHDDKHCPALMKDDGIRWIDLPDGIHQKGVRVLHVGDGHVRAEMFTRLKPGMYSLPDPQAITLRSFGHDD